MTQLTSFQANTSSLRALHMKWPHQEFTRSTSLLISRLLLVMREVLLLTRELGDTSWSPLRRSLIWSRFPSNNKVSYGAWLKYVMLINVVTGNAHFSNGAASFRDFKQTAGLTTLDSATFHSSKPINVNGSVWCYLDHPMSTLSLMRFDDWRRINQWVWFDPNRCD